MSIPSSRLLFGVIPLYGLLIVCGAALALWLAGREETRAGLPKETILDLTLWMLPLAILGARLYYVIFSWDTYRNDLLSILYIWQGGLAIYGGVIVGVITILFFCKKRQLPVASVLDVIAPGLALAQAIGRWGNYFNMEAYGLPITNAALCFFPFGVQIQEGGTWVWHMATFFYESVLDFCIFLVLMIGRRKWFRRRGDAALFYFFLYGAARLFVENLRMDSLYLSSGSIRISQLLSILLCLGINVWFTLRKEASSKKRGLCFYLHQGLFHLSGLAVLIFSLGLLPQLEIEAQTLLLGSFSLLAVFTLFVTYGSAAPQEVCYANHQA